MNIACWQRMQATRFGNEIALIWGAQSYTNAELYDSSSRLAQALLSWSVSPGDRVAIALPNCPELFTCSAAVYQAGMVLVVLADTTAHAVERAVRHSGARVLIAGASVLNSLSDVASELRLVSHDSLAALLGGHSPLPEPIERVRSDAVQLCYTSGTTDAPRAAVFTCGHFDEFLRSRAAVCPDDGASVCSLVAVPPAAFGARLPAMRTVGRQRYVLLERFDAAAALAAIQRHSIHSLPLLPTMAEQLAASLGEREFDCSSLQAINISGAHVPATLIRRLEDKFAARPPRIIVHYGMTETGGIASSELGGSAGDGNVGRVVPGVEVRILDAAGTEVRAGEIGEVVVKAPYAAAGYWNDAESSAVVFRDDGVHTGDLGYLNQSGELALVGRSKDVIIQGGFKVLPVEVARVVESVPGVGQCAVLGVADGLLGEEVVVCVTRRSGSSVAEPQIMARCRSDLEPRKCPGQILFFESLPQTPAGKTDLQRLRADVLRLRELRCEAARSGVAEVSETARGSFVRKIVGEVLQDIVWQEKSVSLADGDEATFAELGVDSVAAARLARRLGERLGRLLPATLVYANPTVRKLCHHLRERLWETAEPQRPDSLPELVSSTEPVAIVGMGCRLPGARGPGSFWTLLESGHDAVRPAPADRAHGGRARWVAGFIEHITHFDAGFFGLQGQADQMDPRHRMLLEVTWEACEDGGQNPQGLQGGRTGVFLGLSGQRYVGGDPVAAAPGMAVRYLCQFLDISGPAVSIDTTCSSSLVAIHSAVTSLQTGECDVAVVGGANFLSEPGDGTDLGVISPDGHSRSFDAGANGFGQGEGCVVVLLKRLSTARAAGDRVYATILATAINHDGRSASLTAPNPHSQAAVIQRALSRAGVAAEAVQYVEAHGTGTPLGDPIEVEALSSVFGNRTGAALAIGSVKTNIGHLEAAAGAAGLVKVALAIARARLPASLHFTTANPAIPWERIPIRVQSSPGPWPDPRAPRIAGISSFGMSGTNAHVIVSEPPVPDEPTGEPAQPDDSATVRVLPLSARTSASLRALATSWADELERGCAGQSCHDISYTASCRRVHLRERMAVVGSTREEWIGQLRAAAVSSRSPRSGQADSSGLVMVFSGQGTQWPRMGRELFEHEPVFRQELLRCAELIDSQVSWRLLEELNRDEASTRLASTEVAQPALFAYQVAMAAVWQAHGVVPAAVYGHSLGEIAAAYVAGAITLEQGARLACSRGRIVASAAGTGEMLHVDLSAAQAGQLCAQYAGQLEIAAINSPGSVALSGAAALIADVCQVLKQRGRNARVLGVGYAFHSSLLESAGRQLTAALAGWTADEPRIAMFSTVTGARAPLLSAQYWGTQVRETVRFLDATNALLAQGHAVFLEVGPHPVLAPYLGSARYIASSRRGEERRALAEGFAEAYQAGIEIDWSRRYRQGRLVSLPTYVWDHAASREEQPTGNLECRLRELVSRHARIAATDIRKDRSLATLGLDSLSMIQLRARLTADFGVSPPPADALAEMTFDGLLARCVRGNLLASPVVAVEEGARLRSLKTSGVGPLHVWVHPIGGGVDCYRALARALPFDAAAFETSRPLELSGGRHSVQRMAALYVRMLAATQIAAPLVLGGWSFGGLIAHEMAIQLHARGQPVPLVVLLDTYIFGADTQPSGFQADADGQVSMAGMRRTLADWVRQGLHTEVTRTRWDELPDEEINRLYAVFRANFSAAQEHVPGYYPGPMLLVQASNRMKSSGISWQEVAPEAEVEVIEGDHYSILRPPGLDALVRIIRERAELAR